MMTAASIALLWVLGVSSGSDGALPPRTSRASVCDAQTPTVRKLPRHPKSLGGPVARTRRLRSGLSFDLAARVHRTVRAHAADERDVVQNDGAATGFEASAAAVAGLRPVGVVVGSVDRHLPALAFTPRSPRGPPLSV